MISTVQETNADAIRAISDLYGDIEADVTFSSGKFWNGVGYEPSVKLDIAPPMKTVKDKETGEKTLIPVRDDVMTGDSRNLPFPDDSFQSVMFDPPFIVAHGKASIIGNRFGSYRTMKDLWQFYDDSLSELARVVKKGGFIVWKCQDTVSSGRQMLSHVHIINKAIESGLYVRDIFILLAKSRVKPHNMTVQKHARKYHSYFLVLEKGKKPNQL